MKTVESVNTLIIKDSVFDGNTETGLDLRTNVNSTIIERCVFSNNGNRGITAVSAELKISESSFLRNTGSQGGCIRAQSSEVTISVSNFTECRSVGGHDGGAVHGERVSFTIAATNFTDNSGGGGGAVSGRSSSFNITSSNFIRNTATSRGGAVWGSATGLFMVADSNFILNEWGDIGGGINTDSFSSLVCCNFIDNSAIFGGGLSVTDFQGSVTINYSSFLNKTAQNSGGGVATFNNIREQCFGVCHWECFHQQHCIFWWSCLLCICLLYTSDAADE